jgi:SAM-dependent methyltransferase
LLLFPSLSSSLSVLLSAFLSLSLSSLLSTYAHALLVRFLKTPKILVDNGTVTLSAVITLTTDLGETFYPHDIQLAATLREPDHGGDIFLRKTLQWKSDMRSLSVSFDLTNTEIDWPAKLHVHTKATKSTYDCFEDHHGRGHLPGIVSVWSETLNPTKGALETHRRVERRFTPLTGRTLNIFEDTGESIARHLWDGSLSLTAYLDRVVALRSVHEAPLLEKVLSSATYKKLNVLELGCGCGVVGIGLAQTVPDCDVLLTDLPEVDELVARNIEVANPAMSSKIEFAPLDWEAPLPLKVASRTFGLILVAECIYNSDSIPPLVDTLERLIQRSPKAVVLISTKVRHESEDMFWDLFHSKGFQKKSQTSLPVPGEPGYGYGDSAPAVDVYIYQGPRPYNSHSPPSSKAVSPA